MKDWEARKLIRAVERYFNETTNRTEGGDGKSIGEILEGMNYILGISLHKETPAWFLYKNWEDKKALPSQDIKTDKEYFFKTFGELLKDLEKDFSEIGLALDVEDVVTDMKKLEIFFRYPVFGFGGNKKPKVAPSQQCTIFE